MVYPEHCQYLTLETARRALAAGDLAVVDIEPVDDDGSIRLWARPFQVAGEPTPSVRALLAAEGAAGLHSAGGHLGLAEAIPRVHEDLIAFLVEARAAGHSVVGYGASGRGNALLNYRGIGPNLLRHVVDRNPYKHGCLTPGTRVPVFAPERLARDCPDYVLVLPRNLRAELVGHLAYVRTWGGRLVFPVPSLEVV